MISKNKKIFFVGIKGVGMAGLAILAKQAGIQVSGSDIGEEFITDKELKAQKIKVFEGFDTRFVNKFIADTQKENVFVVATAAHRGMENPQVVYAKKLGLKVESYGKVLGEFMSESFLGREIEGISVAGSHGKTTVSAMLSTCLVKAGHDPSYVVGTGEIFPIGAPGHFGKGKYFVAEADEYLTDIKLDKTPKFLYQKPKIAIITNIDFDHPDVFQNISAVKDVFFKFAKNIKENGALIIHGGNSDFIVNFKKVRPDVRVITYGDSLGYDIHTFSHKIAKKGSSTQFSVSGNILDEQFSISLFGFHNVQNSMAVIAALYAIGIPPKKIKRVLALYKGCKRRLEYVGKTENGAVILDDYAHHPEEIKSSLEAVKNTFPGRKIVCIFQPHTYSRTKALFDEFSSCFSEVDELILIPTFASMRKEMDSEDTDTALFESIKSEQQNVHFFKSFDDVIEYLNRLDSKESVIITMGAGDVYKISAKLKPSRVQVEGVQNVKHK